MIVKAMRMKGSRRSSPCGKVEKRNPRTELITNMRSFSPEPGKRGGSTKDPFKTKVVEEAAKHGISKATVEKVIAKEKGPTQKPAVKNPSPESLADTIRWLLNMDKERGKPTRAQLEHATISLVGKITDLQRELNRIKLEQLPAQLNILQFLFGAQYTVNDLVKLHRALAKKYHPDGKSNKMFSCERSICRHQSAFDRLTQSGQRGRN